MTIRSKNEIHVRGQITSDIKEIIDGYLFTISTEVKHNGKVYKMDFEAWAGLRVKDTMTETKRGDTVEIEGPLSHSYRIIGVMFYNVTLEQERLKALQKQGTTIPADTHQYR